MNYYRTAAAALLGSTLLTGHATAAIVEYSGTAAASLNTRITGADPNRFECTDIVIPEVGEPFCNFNERVEIDFYFDLLYGADEANVPEDALPGGPDAYRDVNVPFPQDPNDVRAEGFLFNGAWRFDDTVLAEDMRAAGSDGTLYGSANVTSNFYVERYGETWGEGSTAITQAYAANSYVDERLFGDTTAFDVFALVADTDLTDENQVIMFFVWTDTSYLEDNTGDGKTLDPFAADAILFSYENTAFAAPEFGGFELFDQNLSGVVVGSDPDSGFLPREADGSISETAAISSRVISDNSGKDEMNPILTPEISESTVEGEGSVFTFDLSPEQLESAELLWLDPDVAVGYRYTATNASFEKIQLPGASVPDSDGYTVSVGGDFLRDEFGIIIQFLPGEMITFADYTDIDVVEFIVGDIDPALGLDPLANDVFNLGVGLAYGDLTLVSVSQSAIVECFGDDCGDAPLDDISPVPLPGSLAFMLAGLAGLGGLSSARRRRS